MADTSDLKSSPSAEEAQPTEGLPRADRAKLFNVLLAVAAISAVVLAWTLAKVLLLLVAAILVAVLLHAIADPLRRLTHLPRGLAVGLAGILVLSALAGVGWLFGSQLSAQLAGLVRDLPSAFDALKDRIAQSSLGASLLPLLSPDGNVEGLFKRLFSAIPQLFGVAAMATQAATDFILVLVAGIYLALSPQSYRDGLIALAPKASRQKLTSAFNQIGTALRSWLLGQGISMAIVGVLTGIAAMLLGLPNPLALGLVAALAEFIPIFGPAIALVPALPLAFMQGPELALWTLLVYLGIQQIESNVLTPLIQKWKVSLPPVTLILAVAAFGLLFGPLGVLLATPIAVMIAVVVERFYVEGVLGEHMPSPGRQDAN